MELIISASGQARCVYDEALDLAALGKLHIRRASRVEPTPDGHWTADLSPVHGPLLGPFARWSQAIQAERDWLASYWLPEGAIT